MPQLYDHHDDWPPLPPATPPAYQRRLSDRAVFAVAGALTGLVSAMVMTVLVGCPG